LGRRHTAEQRDAPSDAEHEQPDGAEERPPSDAMQQEDARVG